MNPASPKHVTYHLNGTAVIWWRRIASSKTFWIIAAFVLTAADRWNRGEITSAEFFQITQIGVIGILIRTAMSRAELAANAADPTVGAVTAKEEEASLPRQAAALGACIIGAGVSLTACALQ